MYKHANTLALLAKLGRRTMVPVNGTHTAIHSDFNIDFSNWNWHQGVALYGLWQAGQALGDSSYDRFIGDWIDLHIAQGVPPPRVNSTAPLLTIACLHEQSPKPGYEKLCNDFASWCMTSAPRLADGTFDHDAIYHRQVWADTLFMCAFFLAKWGRMTGDDALLDQAAMQFINHYRYLADPRTGLLWHGYDDTKKAHIGVLWGRGNGWYAIAATEVLALLGDRHPAHGAILAGLRRQFAGITATQDDSGAWRTVMNEPGSYLEATCTAALACAFRRAVELGLVDDQCQSIANRAYARLLGWINDKGELTHASAGTPIKPDATGYNAIPYAVTPFSQGLALIALACEHNASRAAASSGS
jgi:unsaturated rhamnogalacturonyl hydrolase